jgi:tetratricopeptide (TPR) repeat protein
MPPLETVALPEEQPQMAAMLGAFAKMGPQDVKGRLALLDKALVDLPRPTKLRGVVQVTRAMALEHLGRYDEAMAAIGEAIRLLPDYSGPLMTAGEIHLYSNNPGLAADDLLRATEIDPDSAQGVPDYDLDGLMRRLDGVRDRKHAQMLGDRLLDLGWTGAGVRSRTKLAKSAIERAVEAGDLPRARQLIPSLLDPAASYELLSLNAYQPIWADLEAWSGPKLSMQWHMYLDEARRRWDASGDLERGADYAVALTTAGANDRLIAEFLPLFDTPHDAVRNWQMMFIVPKLAQALMYKGQTADAIALFDRAGKIWPLGSTANALNIAANRAVALLNGDRPAEALKQIDLAITDSHNRPGEINTDAIAGMHQVRACALHALGRGNEAAVSATIAAQAGHSLPEIEVAVCTGNMAAARTALIKGLSRPEERPDIAAFLQPEGRPSAPTVYARAQRAANDTLRHDPQVLAAFAPYGRVMAYAANEGAPK